MARRRRRGSARTDGVRESEGLFNPSRSDDRPLPFNDDQPTVWAEFDELPEGPELSSGPSVFPSFDELPSGYLRPFSSSSVRWVAVNRLSLECLSRYLRRRVLFGLGVAGVRRRFSGKKFGLLSKWRC